MSKGAQGWNIDYVRSTHFQYRTLDSAWKVRGLQLNADTLLGPEGTGNPFFGSHLCERPVALGSAVPGVGRPPEP